jgi:lipopolysaccharide/colanic/teichoic acid biosynthesis glycosyltransferase
VGAQIAFPDQALRHTPLAQSMPGAGGWPWATSLTLGAADIAAITIARVVALGLWHWIHPARALPDAVGYWESLGFFALAYAACGLYSGVPGVLEELRRAVTGTALACLLLMAWLFFFPATGSHSRGLLALSGWLTAVAVPLTAARDLSGVLGLELRQNLSVPLNSWTKRVLDIAGALVLGILALPVLGVAALWIKLAGGGSVIYRQEREGERGRSLWMPKLRTMHPDAEALLPGVLAASPQVRAEWMRGFKLKKDPRILPGVGKFLRRTSLDELPQLWSVLKGEMSLVGPRPLPRYHLNEFGTRFRALRGGVRPGLTGLWQVSDRADCDLGVQEVLDTYYIRNWSLWLDLYVLARTVRAVLFPKGGY